MIRTTLVAMPLLASVALLAGAKGLDGRTGAQPTGISATQIEGVSEEMASAWRSRRDRDHWGWDFWNNDNNPTDDNGHGTHTARTVTGGVLNANNAVR